MLFCRTPVASRPERMHMDAHTVLLVVGCVIAFYLYVPLIKGIYSGDVKQSFATWFLWVALDAIALGSIVVQGGNFIFLACYVFGGTLVAISLIVKKQFTWTWFENLVLCLVAVCIVVWCLSGPRMATIASTLAVVISGIPQFKDSWQKPDRTTGFIYAGYILANGLFMFAGKTWTIEERFYPGCCVLLCTAIAVAALRKPNSVNQKSKEKL
jgi:hypothetical protein